MGGGGAQCCYGGMRCASTLPDEDLRQYYFKYEIVYERFDPNKHTPVYSSVFSASSDSAAICHVEFNPPVCSGGDHQEGPEREHTFGRCLDEDTATTEFMWQVNSDIDIIYGWGHAHIGSLNGVHTTVTEPAPSAESTNAQLVGFININGRDNDMKQTESGVTRDLCTSEPLYGDSEGDEDSFLAGVTTCTTAPWYTSSPSTCSQMPTIIRNSPMLRRSEVRATPVTRHDRSVTREAAAKCLRCKQTN